jgi:hypothetical protein
LLDAERLEGLSGVAAAIWGAQVAAGGFSVVPSQYATHGVSQRPHERGEPSILEVVERVGTGMLSTLVRMRELAVQGTWSWLEESDKLFLQCEFIGLTDELSNIAGGNDRSMGIVDVHEMWNGSRPNGVGSSGMIRVNLGLWEFKPSQIGIRVEQIGINSLDQARSAISMIDSAIDRIECIRSEYDFLYEQVESALRALSQHVGTYDSASESSQKDIFTPQRGRLMAMQKVGVTARKDDVSFQQSIRALVQ